MAELIAKTYGDALYEVGAEQNRLKEFWEEAKELCAVLRQNPEFLHLLTNPRLTREELDGVVSSVFGGRISVEMMNFMLLLIDKNRQAHIVDILAYFQERCKEYYCVGTVYVTAPMPLSGVQKQRLEAYLLRDTHFQKLEMHYELDKSLLGGLVIRIGDRVIDTSVKGKLDRLTGDLYKIQIPVQAE